MIGAGDSIASTLAYTEPQLNSSYREVFGRLDRMADDLRRDRSLPNFARAIALYHMVVEATMAQPGQHFIEDYFVKSGTMPGFSEGMANVSRDEQRHIGFGVKVLSECFAESDECKEAVAELLREVMPYPLGVFTPPNWDLEYTRCYGFELEDIFAFGLRSVRDEVAGDRAIRSRRCPACCPVDPDLPPEEIARASDQADEGRGDGRAERAAAVLAGDPGAVLRPDLRASRRRARGRVRCAADDDPVGLLRCRPVVRAASPTARPPRRRGARRRPTSRCETTWADWIAVADPRRGPAPDGAAPPDPAARLAAQPPAPEQGLPAEADQAHLTLRVLPVSRYLDGRRTTGSRR